jgi:3-hydroxyisobutyrate dehydrogenase
MCGGDQGDFDKVSGAIDSYAKMCQLMGPAGAGQLTKMVNQICIAGVVQGLAEGLNLALKAGLDGAQVVDVISKGAAQSWQMENRYQTMLTDEYEHGFAVQWMRKDLSICMQEAKNQGISLPMAALVDQFYAEVEGMGGARWDTSALLARMVSLRPKP